MAPKWNSLIRRIIKGIKLLKDQRDNK